MTEKEFIAEIAKLLPKEQPDEIAVWSAREMLKVLDDTMSCLLLKREEVEMK